MAFEKWAPKGPKARNGRTSFLAQLEIGQSVVFEGKTKRKCYPMVYNHQRKTGKEFSYMEAINGIVIRRDK